MENSDKEYIIHISHPSGSPFILYPDGESFLDAFEKDGLEGLYGKDPESRDITSLKTGFYREVGMAVDEWIKDVGFIPRFLLSSLVFLFVYLFMTVVLRDPLPVIDELLIASGASFACYYGLLKRDRQSKKAVNRRVKLREKVDAIRFNQHQEILQIEEFIENHPHIPRETVLGVYYERHPDASLRDPGRQILKHDSKKYGIRKKHVRKKLFKGN